MAFFSKIFGGGNKEPKATKREDPVDYEGLQVIAAPLPEGSQWRLAGFIIKQDGDKTLEREFIRADLFHSRGEAVEFSINKGKQVIDQSQGRLFADGAATGRA